MTHRQAQQTDCCTWTAKLSSKNRCTTFSLYHLQ